MFQDEGRFGRINQPRRRWGARPVVPAQLVRECTHACAAVSPLDGKMDSLILPEVNHRVMSIFLAELARRHPDEEIVLFLDGAGWHKAREPRAPDHVHWQPLPPYSPELNPGEHLWEDIREKWFENLVFDSLDAVEDRLEEAPRGLDPTARASPPLPPSIGSLVHF
jgi:transposase